MVRIAFEIVAVSSVDFAVLKKRMTLPSLETLRQ